MWGSKAVALAAVVCLAAACGGKKDDTPDAGGGGGGGGGGDGTIEGALKITGTPTWVKTPTVRLELTATATEGATLQDMAFSNDGTTWSAFEPYASVRESWTLSPGDGAKTVHAKVRDSEGGEGTFTTQVQLDGTAPQLTSMYLDANATYARTSTVPVTLTAPEDGGSPLAQVCTVIASVRSCRDFSAGFSVTLSGGDGAKTVTATVIDAAGNESAPYSDAITVDTTAPVVTAVTLAGDYTRSLSVDVQVTATDATSGLAKLQLSEDGVVFGAPVTAEPTLTFTLSAGPDGTRTVHVAAIDAAGNVSEAASDTIVLDTTAPVVSAVSLGGAYTRSLMLNVEVTATDEASGVAEFQFSEDGISFRSPVTAGSMLPFTLSPGSDGTRTVYVMAIDAAGNVSVGPHPSDTIVLDTTAPVVTSVSLAGDYSGSRTVTVQIAATDATSGVAEFQLSEDGTTFGAPVTAAPALPFTFSAGADGVATVHVAAIDAAGNVSAAPHATDSVFIDTTPPSAGTLTLSGTGGATATRELAVSYTVSATDGASGLAHHCVALDATAPPADSACWKSAATLTGTVQLPSGDGMKTVRAWFRDAVGNVSTGTSATIRLDQTAPELTAFSLADGALFTGVLSVGMSFEASDLGSGVADLCHGTDNPPTTCVPVSLVAKTTLPAGDGAKTVHARVRDLAGNASAVVNDQITLDQTAPVPSAVSINAGATYANNLTVNVTTTATETGSGVALIAFSIDDGTFSTPVSYSAGGNPVTLGAGEGVRKVAVKLTDAVGNVSTVAATDTIDVDMTAPTGGTLALAGSGGAAATNTAEISYSVSATDARSGFAQYCLTESSAAPALDAACWKAAATTTGKFTLTTTEGSHSVRAWFRDAANNVSAAVVRSIIYDVTPPELNGFIFAGGLGYSPTSDVEVDVDAVELGSGLGTLCVDTYDPAGNCMPYGPGMTFSAAFAGPGYGEVYGYVIDVAGNTSNEHWDYYEVDPTAPVLTSTNINGGATFTTSADVSVALAATEDYSPLPYMEISIDGAAFGSKVAYANPFSARVPQTDGSHTISVRIYNASGLVSETRGDTIILDTTPPTGTVVLNNGATYGGSTVTATLTANDANGLNAVCLTTTALASAPGVGDPCWQAWATTRSVDLGVPEGTQTVYAWFRDSAMLTSTNAVSDSITVDAVAPSIPAGLAAVARDRSATFSWAAATDGTSGISHYEVGLPWAIDVAPASVWASVAGTGAAVSNLANEVMHYVAVRAVDNAGNVSNWSANVAFTPRFPFSFPYRPPFGASLNAVVVLTDGTTYAFGERGAAFKSTNIGGTTPTSTRFDTRLDVDWHGAALGANNVLVAVGGEGKISAGSGERGWRAVDVGGNPTETLRAVVSDGGSAFFAVGDNGRIIRGTVSSNATDVTGASFATVQSPTTSNLRAIARSDTGVLVAVGDNATILRSNDGGWTWSAVTAPGGWTSSHFSAIAYNPLETAFYIGDTTTGTPTVFGYGLNGAVFSVDGAQNPAGEVVALHYGSNEGISMIASVGGAPRLYKYTPWVDEFTPAGFYEVTFTDAGSLPMRALGSFPGSTRGGPLVEPTPIDRLVVVGAYGQALASPLLSAGVTPRSPGIPNWMHSVFASGDHAWAVGMDGLITYTGNGGATWTAAATGTTAEFRDVTGSFGGATAVGDGGRIFSTPAPGGTWTQAPAVTAATLFSVDCTAQQCVAVGTDGALVTRTSASGWSLFQFSAGAPPLRAVDTYVDSGGGERVITVGNGGSLRRAQGGTWTNTEVIADGATLRGVAAAPDGVVLAVTEAGKVWKSVDHGASWTQLPFSDWGYVGAISYAGGTRWYIAGGWGGLFRTDDAGATWKRLNTRTTTDLMGVHVDQIQGNVWVSGYGDTVLKSTTAGE